MDGAIVFQVVMAVFTVLLGLITTGIAWWVKTVWSMTVELQRSNTDLRVKFGEYATRGEIDGKLEQIFEQLRELTSVVAKAAAQAHNDYQASGRPRGG